jgi:hypothetical protein
VDWRGGPRFWATRIRTSSSSKYFLFSRLYFSTYSWGGFCWTLAGWFGGGGYCWGLNCGGAITTSRSAGGPMGVLADEEALTLIVCKEFWIGGEDRGRKGRPRGRRTDGGRRSVKWVESGNGNFELSPLRQNTRFDFCRRRLALSYSIPRDIKFASRVEKNPQPTPTSLSPEQANPTLDKYHQRKSCHHDQIRPKALHQLLSIPNDSAGSELLIARSRLVLRNLLATWVCFTRPPHTGTSDSPSSQHGRSEPPTDSPVNLSHTRTYTEPGHVNSQSPLFVGVERYFRANI